MSKFIRPKSLPSKRGVIVESQETKSGGMLHKYSSGYIEHVDKDGKKTDVLWDLHRRKHEPRLWKCAKTQGGSGAIEFEGLTLDEARARCARELGPVVYVDEYHGFIFYRDGSAPPDLPKIGAN